jgi:hypothetical protein
MARPEQQSILVYHYEIILAAKVLWVSRHIIILSRVHLQLQAINKFCIEVQEHAIGCVW